MYRTTSTYTDLDSYAAKCRCSLPAVESTTNSPKNHAIITGDSTHSRILRRKNPNFTTQTLTLPAHNRIGSRSIERPAAHRVSPEGFMGNRPLHSIPRLFDTTVVARSTAWPTPLAGRVEPVRVASVSASAPVPTRPRPHDRRTLPAAAAGAATGP